MLHNLHAYTEPGHDYPAYVSINCDGHGEHTITVRSRGDAGRNVGVMTLTPEQLERLACDLLRRLGKPTYTPPDPLLITDALARDDKPLRERIKSAHND